LDAIHGPKGDSIIKKEIFPEITNHYVLDALKKKGPFIFKMKQTPEDKSLPVLGPYLLENDIVYLGQWKNGMRHGEGKQIWRDNSLYEGIKNPEILK
jgi:hypothetical protein